MNPAGQVIRMYYECKSCHHEEGRGLLPGTTCGLLLSVWGGLCFGFLVALIRAIWPDGIGWWWLLAGPVSFLFSIVPGALLLHFVAMFLEWITISVFPCKKCGSHRFSFGKTHGFGL
jgi:hypothetical protein